MTGDLRTAAVLLPVYRDAEGELRIVLVMRADDGGQHGGQLGLPGGKPEEGDVDLVATALREAEEEVGLPPETVVVVAALPPLETRATGWCVHPFVGRVPADTAWRLQETEIVGILTPSARALADPDARDRLPFSSLHFPEPLLVDGIDVEGHVLWGMTLRLLDDALPRLLGGEWDV
ncbi:MAG TPA: CoA pyrophosphatase [Gaiella sp.]|jgi:8-oxo-dGTP pyrophosphatase MutT (NUDIX family)|nr:CoA pyrophosphatase [Gaiella sp.]